MSEALARVLEHPAIWRRSNPAAARLRALPTGVAELDARLPGGGWPLGALSEVLFAHDGLGELGLLLPALAELTQAKRRVVLVDPPYLPYAPAWAAAGVDLRYLTELRVAATDAPWSMEQCLRSGCCGAVVGWLADTDYRNLRRLQLAAESGDAIAVLYRPEQHAAHTSPAALRLHVHAVGDDIGVDVIKSRGAFPAQLPTTLSRMH
ncbi:MAG TPA: translesion DNA synthesis-associated protein ImuA [Rhodanobacteraceae bacterium]|jgi:hypothetical protein|nr:translesion DNA synthesis-associated protein ImuA [Rhodanobacteraceae bacterium]